MATRRPSSATSLSRYARSAPQEPADPSQLDFCNAFWGAGDSGVEVLLARMRGAARTMEELRVFWRERAAIEDDYAKRLAKLAKLTLGRDEIGELRNSLETLKLETEKQAVSHIDLAAKMRQELEGPTTQFIARQGQHKRTAQETIQRSFKNKQTQETYVQRSREKYEQDCLKINSYTAQQTLVQGKDLEKVRLKLERAQGTVAGNEKDYQSFTRALQDTSKKWEAEWRAFCDGCQDLEDERIEFMKDNMWSYANALSSVCVSDDESCEHVRVALEQLEVDRDMENFVQSYGTGSTIAEPPHYVNYRAGAVGDGTQGRRPREAHFPRQSKKAPAAYGGPPPPDDQPDTRPVSRAATLNESQQVPEPAPVVPPQPAPAPVPAPPVGMSGYPMPGPAQGQRPQLNPSDSEQVMLKIGDNAYPVDPREDPQRRPVRQPTLSASTATSSGFVPTPGDANDPLAKAMDQLKQDSVRRGTPTRKPSIVPSNGQMPTPTSTTAMSSAGGPGAGLVPPAAGFTASELAQSRAAHDARAARALNFDQTAAAIVGGPPPAPPSANGANMQNGTAPHAKFMQSHPNRLSAEIPVEDVLSTYGQAFPGERDGRLSRASSQQNQQQQQQLQQTTRPGSRAEEQGRPSSRQGFAGIGAQGRSPSPSFHAPGHTSRPVSPAAAPRAVSPRPGPMGIAGISLDAGGKVAQDSLAEEYKRREEEQQRARVFRAQQEEQERRRVEEERRRVEDERRRVEEERRREEGMRRMEEERRRLLEQQQQQPPYFPGAGRQPYGVGPPPPHMQQAPPPQQPTMYQPPPPPQQPPQLHHSATLPPAHSYPQQPQQQQQPPPQRYDPQTAYVPPPPPQHPYSQYPQQPQQAQQPPQADPQTQFIQRHASMSGYQQYGHAPQQSVQYNPPPPPQQQQQPPPPQQEPPQQQQQAMYDQRAPAPHEQLPPTNQWTAEGVGILFYVKALYDYQATIDEEFDFQAGDVIAVTATPEDGWWSGELLDEARRQKGKNIFPSNFVCLF